MDPVVRNVTLSAKHAWGTLIIVRVVMNMMIIFYKRITVLFVGKGNLLILMVIVWIVIKDVLHALNHHTTALLVM